MIDSMAHLGACQLPSTEAVGNIVLAVPALLFAAMTCDELKGWSISDEWFLLT